MSRRSQADKIYNSLNEVKAKAQATYDGRIHPRLEALGKRYREVAEALRPIRGVLLISVLLSLILAVPQQSHEVYKATVERLAGEPLAIARHLLWLGPYVLVSFLIAVEFLRRTRQDAQAAGKRLTLVIAQWVPGVASLMPVLSIAVGMQLAKDWPEWFAPATYGGLAFALVLLRVLVSNAVVAAIGRWSHLRFRFVWRFVVFLIFASSIAVAADPIGLPQAVGVLGVVSLFFCLLVVVISLGTHLLDRYGVPLNAALAVLVFVLAMSEINNNHRVLPISAEGRALGTVGTAFREWLGSREDREAFGDERYPVYIVAAQGGGIFAAYQASYFLAQMQDRCPSFAQHVFAISGVSGGSIGASIFAGLADAGAENGRFVECRPDDPERKPGWFAAKTHKILAKDHLSPLVAATLFPDFLQRFLPFRVDAWDRARVLERTFSESWDDVMKGQSGYLDRPLRATWNPRGAAPALIFNATRVHDGRRVAISPFRIEYRGNRLVHIGSYLEDDEDVSIVTGAVLSARFPWITPAGSLVRTTKNGVRTAHLVDGGYFENSGAETARDLIREIEKEMGGQAKIRIRLIVLTTKEEWASRTRAGGFSEILAPVHALLSTRSERGALAIARAQQEHCKGCDDFDYLNDEVYFVEIDEAKYDFALGWHISEATREEIGRQLGRPGECALPGSPDALKLPADQRQRRWRSRLEIPNNCVLRALVEGLQPPSRAQQNAGVGRPEEPASGVALD